MLALRSWWSYLPSVREGSYLRMLAPRSWWSYLPSVREGSSLRMLDLRSWWSYLPSMREGSLRMLDLRSWWSYLWRVREGSYLRMLPPGLNSLSPTSHLGNEAIKTWGQNPNLIKLCQMKIYPTYAWPDQVIAKWHLKKETCFRLA